MGRVNGQREFVVCMYKYGSVEPFWGTSGWRITIRLTKYNSAEGWV